jgi:hypothetical protein
MRKRSVLAVAKETVFAAGRYTPFVGADDPVGIRDAAEVVPVAVMLLPTVMFPLASFTMLFVLPDGWMMLIVFNVEMAASC